MMSNRNTLADRWIHLGTTNEIVEPIMVPVKKGKACVVLRQSPLSKRISRQS